VNDIVDAVRSAEPPTYSEVAESLDGGTDELDEMLENGALEEVEGDGSFAEIQIPGDSPEDAMAAAVEWFHDQLDRTIDAHEDEPSPDEVQPGEDSPDPEDVRPDTAYEYWSEVRGFSDDTIEEKMLGWAPPDATRELLTHLQDRGLTEDAVRGTGLFTIHDDGTPSLLFSGRYVTPYFDDDGEPVFAMARCTGNKGGGAAGYDGHPDDFIAGKYAKPATSDDHAELEEPLYGADSLDDHDTVLMAGGILDAIRLQEEGWAAISPVRNAKFTDTQLEYALDLLEDHGVERLIVMPDAERASFEERGDGQTASIGDAINISGFGEGMKGAFDTADKLEPHDVEVRIADIPLGAGPLRKTDPDDLVRDGLGSLDQVVLSAKPAGARHDYNGWQNARREKRKVTGSSETIESSGNQSALYDLDVVDVIGMQAGERGENPLGHHGNRGGYFVVADDGVTAHDKKYDAGYNALTMLACMTGERRAENPGGSLDRAETAEVWRHAKENGFIAEDDPIPRKALAHVAVEAGVCDTVDDDLMLPGGAYGPAVDAVDDVLGVAPGRDANSGDWARVISAIRDDDTSSLTARDRAYQELQSETTFKTEAGSETIWYYDPQSGIYRDTGKEFIWSRLTDELGALYTPATKSHVIDRVRGDTVNPAEPVDLGGDLRPPRVAVKNGTVNAMTGELMDHAAEYELTTQIPVEYDADAEPERFDEFLEDIFNGDEDKKRTVYETFACIMVPGIPVRNMVWIVGPGRSGKGTLLRVMEEFVGKQNKVSESAKRLADDDFAVASLDGARANLDGDVEGGVLENTKRFTRLTGGDTVRANPKGEDPYDLRNKAQLVFASDDPPKFDDQGSGLWDRLVQLHIPDVIPQEKRRAKVELLGDIASDAELSGILNKALEYYPEMMERGALTAQNSSPEQSRENWQKRSAPVEGFADECLKFDYDAKTKVDELYAAFTHWRLDNDVSETSKRSFCQQLLALERFEDVDSTRAKEGDRRVTKYVGIALTQDGSNRALEVLDNVDLDTSPSSLDDFVENWRGTSADAIAGTDVEDLPFNND